MARILTVNAAEFSKQFVASSWCEVEASDQSSQVDPVGFQTPSKAT